MALFLVGARNEIIISKVECEPCHVVFETWDCGVNTIQNGKEQIIMSCSELGIGRRE